METNDTSRDGDAKRLRSYAQCPTNSEEVEWFLQQICNRDAVLREACAVFLPDSVISSNNGDF